MSERETITCPNPKCRLVQFETKAQACRRCKMSYAPPAPIDKVAQVEYVPPQGSPVDLAHAMQMTLAARRGTMSQNQLAARMGCPRTYISKVEQGRAVPIMASLERFARAFRIPLWVLVLEIETMRALLTATRESQ